MTMPGIEQDVLTTLEAVPEKMIEAAALTPVLNERLEGAIARLRDDGNGEVNNRIAEVGVLSVGMNCLNPECDDLGEPVTWQDVARTAITDQAKQGGGRDDLCGVFFQEDPNIQRMLDRIIFPRLKGSSPQGDDHALGVEISKTPFEEIYRKF